MPEVISAKYYTVHSTRYYLEPFSWPIFSLFSAFVVLTAPLRHTAASGRRIKYFIVIIHTHESHNAISAQNVMAEWQNNIYRKSNVTRVVRIIIKFSVFSVVFYVVPTWNGAHKRINMYIVYYTIYHIAIALEQSVSERERECKIHLYYRYGI